MKKSESKFIGIREIVVVTLFSVLTFVVSMLTAMPFAASVHLQLYVGYALMAIISGPVYVLIITHDSELIYHFADHVYKMYRPRSYHIN
ncbi:MAG: hypothetical protein K6C68_02650 [Ruminococcus sp.]|nr:hypothetical protein [Ruminococcus sp.]